MIPPPRLGPGEEFLHRIFCIRMCILYVVVITMKIILKDGDCSSFRKKMLSQSFCEHSAHMWDEYPPF